MQGRVFFLSLFLPALVATSQAVPQTPDKEYEHALWIAESKGVLKIASSDGKKLCEIEEKHGADAVAVDERGGVLWAVAKKSLNAYSFNCVLLSETPVESEGEHASLAVDPVDGSVWLGSEKKLMRFDATGKQQTSTILKDNVRGLSVEPVNSAVWVGSEHSIASFDKQGSFLYEIGIPKGENLKTLEYDGTLHELWIAGEHSLFRLKEDGTFTFSLAFEHGEHLSADGKGGLWAATHKRMLRLDEQGRILADIEPFDGEGEIVAVRADLADGGAWAANQKQLAQLDAAGTIVRRLDFHGTGTRIDALAVYSDRLAPDLTVIQPAAGAYINNALPEFLLVYADVGIGVDTNTLAVTRDGISFSVQCQFDEAQARCMPTVSLPDGNISLEFAIQDFAGNRSVPSALDFTVDTVLPVIAINSPANGAWVNTPEILLEASVSEPADVTFNGQGILLDADNAFALTVALSEGENRLVVEAKDWAGNAAIMNIAVFLDTVAPALVALDKVHFTLDADGTVTVTGDPGSVEPDSRVRVTNTRTGQIVEVGADVGGGFVAQLTAQAGDVLSIQTADAAGNASDPADLPLPASGPKPNSGYVPPDPSTIAPPLDPTLPTTVFTATEFLYSGVQRIQFGVEPGTIEPRRISVLRGKVLDREGRPVPGVTVSILNHPEFGWTGTREDGSFDLAVNGGGQLTVHYEHQEFLPIQRDISPRWFDWTWLPDVVAARLDAQVTEIDLSAGAPVQVARGSVISDADGQRQATVLFPQGTQAEMVLQDGSIAPLAKLHVRATEYTIGENGVNAMPGQLPPTSGYTYAVELSVDEAMAAGATEVRFNQPVPFYVDNFIGFPVGEDVPLGWYDRRTATWMPSPSGRVIKVLSITNGLADLVVAKSGAAATAEELTALGITDAERAQLATLYAPGKTLWRSPIPHFTPWDCNWPYGPPSDAIPPYEAPVEPADEGEPDDPEECPGCIIEAENQVLGESIPIAGTSFSLNYRSNRVPGYAAARSVEIPLSDATLPSALKRIELEVQVAGQVHRQSFTPAPNRSVTFVWDGKDGLGRPVHGALYLTYIVRYVYQAVYYGSGNFAASFGQFGAQKIEGNRLASEVSLVRTDTIDVSADVPTVNVLNGWALSPSHSYTHRGPALFRGDGNTQRPVMQGANIITTEAGGQFSGFRGDGQPAKRAWLNFPTGVAVAADGSIYISDTYNGRIRRVTPDGIIATIVGTDTRGFNGDGLPGTQTQLGGPHDLVFGPDGSLYFIDSYRVRRLGRDGIVTTVAGNGVIGVGGIGGPAKNASVGDPEGLAVGTDGTLYISDREFNRILRVGLDGLLTKIAGNGWGFYGDGGPAINAMLKRPEGMAVGPDGSLYIADTGNNRVRRITPDGKITTVAGITGGFGGDRGPAIKARLNLPAAVAVGSDSSLYIADQANHRIRQVWPDGTIVTIAGNNRGSYGDGVPASTASLDNPRAVALGPDGGLYIADMANNRVRRIDLTFGGLANGEFLVSAEDGSEYYIFAADGRHLRTLDSLTGSLRHSLAYDINGRMIGIEDGDGNVIRIERDGVGTATAIVAPGGQRTELALDSNGWLASVTNPAGETHNIVHRADGLLTRFSKPSGSANTYQYDDLGRLLLDRDPVGGGWDLTRVQTGTGYETHMTSAEGRITQFVVEHNGTETVRTTIGPDGTRFTRNVTSNDTSGSELSTAPDGTVRVVSRTADPRVGMQAPYVNGTTITTPSGLTFSSSDFRYISLIDRTNPLSLWSWHDDIDINGRYSWSEYSATTRTWTSTSAENRVQTLQNDARGKPILSQFADLAAAHYAYDARGQITTIAQGEDTEARITVITYDVQGNPTSVTDPVGRSITFEYDLVGRVTQQTMQDGRTVQYTYDDNGNLTSIVPPGRTAHVFDYTPVDLEQAYIPPALNGAETVTRYTYNLDRDTTKIERPDGKVVDFAYDTGGRLSTMTFSLGQIAYGYHSNTGKISTITAPDGGVLSYAWDGFLQNSEAWTGTVNGSVSRSYDNNFWVTSLAVNGIAIGYGYDNDGLLISAGALSLTRNAQNGLLTGTTLGLVSTVRTHNVFGELATENATAGGNSLIQTTYVRDKLGRITEKMETVEGITTTYAYTYDTAGRLSEVKQNGFVTAGYSYDANGNRSGKTTPSGIETGVYDAQDRMVNYGNAGYEYTANGELLAKTENGATARYAYDELGNLLQVKLPGDVVVDYVNDGRNRRIGKKVNGTLVQGFLYQDQLEPVAELDGSGNIVARFVYASQSHVPDYMEKGGNVYRILSDHLGSPRFVVDSQTGIVVQRMDYDEFGNVIRDTNPGFQPFGYAGGIYDLHTGLVRFGARDYEARSGRWTAKDPIGFDGRDFGLYTYVNGNPISFTDPLGLAPSIPNPNNAVPGGPWTQAGSGQLPGDFYGPKKPSGGRDICRWVPAESEGGPPGSQGYWKTKTPGGQWQRYSPAGTPITAQEAHPGNRAPVPVPPSVPWWVRIGAGLGAMFYSSPAY